MVVRQCSKTAKSSLFNLNVADVFLFKLSTTPLAAV